VPGHAGDGVVEAVKFVKDVLRRLPGKGRPYFAYRHLATDAEEFRHHAPIELLLNYAGIYQQLESRNSVFAREDRLDVGNEVAPTARRTAYVDVAVEVRQGELRVFLQYHRGMKHQLRIQHWATGFMETLRVAARTLAATPQHFTPSDFPLLGSSYAGLDNLVNVQLAALQVKPSEVDDIFPASPLQQGILLSREKGTASYANYHVWRCSCSTGDIVQPDRLLAAWRAVVDRHAILSTIFVHNYENGGYLQVALKGGGARAKTAYIQSGCESPLETLGKIERPRLAEGEPPHAFTVCRSTSQEVACRLDISHSLFDAFCLPILIHDLTHAYDGHTLSTAIPYRNLISYLQHSSHLGRLEYWKSCLADVTRCCFPALRSLGVKEGEETSAHGTVALPLECTRAIDDHCRSKDYTRAVFLQVAWALVLSRFTGMDEVCFGYLASGRDAPIDGVEEIVGPFVSMLVARIYVRTPIAEVFSATRQRSIENLAHQQTSFADILRELDLGGQQLFNTSMTVRERWEAGGETGGSLRLQSVKAEDPHEVSLG
jgi:non-ribosomal peptide synthase protein (TIGR01720 family)